MRTATLGVVCALALVVAARAEDKVEPKGDKIESTVHNGHFESNKSGLTGDVSFLVFNDAKGFGSVFGTAAVMGKKYDWVPKDAFDKKLVAAVIHRGNAPWEYKVEKVTVDGDTAYVQYTATEGKASTAKFASPLLVSFEKGKIAKVVFLENGKKAGTAEVGK
jgi:hypothetical protein